MSKATVTRSNARRPIALGDDVPPEAFDFLAEQEPGSMVAIGRRPGLDSVEFSRDPKSIGRAIDNPSFLASFGPFAAFRVYQSDESNCWREIARPIDGRLYPDTVAEWAPIVSPGDQENS